MFTATEWYNALVHACKDSDFVAQPEMTIYDGVQYCIEGRVRHARTLRLYPVWVQRFKGYTAHDMAQDLRIKINGLQAIVVVVR